MHGRDEILIFGDEAGDDGSQENHAQCAASNQNTRRDRTEEQGRSLGKCRLLVCWNPLVVNMLRSCMGSHPLYIQVLSDRYCKCFYPFYFFHAILFSF